VRIGFLSHLDANLYRFRLPVMQELLKNGHIVYVIVPHGEYTEALEREGVITIIYEIERSSLNPLKELVAINMIYRAVKDLKLDILHTFMVKPNIYGTFAARRAKIPVIVNTVTGLGSFFIDGSLKAKVIRKVIETLYKIVFNLSTGVIFQNRDDKELFERSGIIKKFKSYLVRSSGVDTTYFDNSTVNMEDIKKLEDELKVKDKKVVLMIARAIWHKGIAEYSKSAEILNRKDVEFLLVGGVDDGNPSNASLKWLKEQNNINWLGERSDIKELIALSDIVVLPSYREGVPRTLLEAASMGKALVATNVPGCREVVEHEKNGLLVELKSSKSLSEAIGKLLDDVKLQKEYALASRKKAIEEFDVKKVVLSYSEIYSKLLNVQNTH